MKTSGVLVVGAGIGGLAAAFAGTRAGWPVRLVERSAALAEVGAGIQLGPNVTRILHGWGLTDELARVAAFPDRLQVRDAMSGRELAVLGLGARMQQRYGAPYATVHRADLHQVLQAGLQAQGVQPELGREFAGLAQTDNAVLARFVDGSELPADLLVGADGLWSAVRRELRDDGAPRPTGHLAYRALVAQAQLPAALRSTQVTAWLGPGMHVVQYPVRGGDWLNVVVIVHAPPASAAATQGQLANWSQAADAAQLRSALRNCSAPLVELVAAIGQWRLWVLCDRPPMSGPAEHGAGRVLLVGDAAHPMRPYLAQGAGMAIEDAAALGGLCSARSDGTVGDLVQQFSRQRWRRNRMVQLRARRNGRIFHADGPLRFGRDIAMRLLGERLLDLPWLYRG